MGKIIFFAVSFGQAVVFAAVKSGGSSAAYGNIFLFTLRRAPFIRAEIFVAEHIAVHSVCKAKMSVVNNYFNIVRQTNTIFYYPKVLPSALVVFGDNNLVDSCFFRFIYGKCYALVVRLCYGAVRRYVINHTNPSLIHQFYIRQNKKSTYR